MINDIDLAKSLLIQNNNNPLQVALFAVQQIKKLDSLKNEIQKLNLSFDDQSDYRDLIKTSLSSITYSDILVTTGRPEIIEFFWNREAEGEFILDHHREALYETATNIITQAMKEGDASGVLTDNIFMEDSDVENDEEGISYVGNWRVKESK